MGWIYAAERDAGMAGVAVKDRGRGYGSREKGEGGAMLIGLWLWLCKRQGKGGGQPCDEAEKSF